MKFCANMERFGDDSQLEHPIISSSPDDSLVQPQILGGGDAQKLSINDCFTYLKTVKDTFGDKSQTYNEFLKLILDLKSQSIDIDCTILKLKELFKGHRDLILGFNTFLPKGYEIPLLLEDEESLPMMQDVFEVMSFFNKLKMRFQNDSHVYKSFLDIVHEIHTHKCTTKTYQQVAILFETHQDLLDDLTHFMPDSFVAALGEKIPAISNANHDLNICHPDVGHDKALMKVEKEYRKCAEKRKGRKEYSGRDSEWDDEDLDHNNNMNSRNMQRLPNKRKFSYRDEDSIAEGSCQGVYNQELLFYKQVKEKYDSDEYQEVLKYLQRAEVITRSTLQTSMDGSLGKNPNLVNCFNECSARCEKNNCKMIDGCLAGVMSKRHLLRPMKNKDKKRKRERDDTENDKRERNKERERPDKNVPFVNRDVTKVPAFPNKEVVMAKSVSELDLFNCQHCNPSYQLLPENYPTPSASTRTIVGNAVLNDRWRLVTSGSEDYSFKDIRKNEYEEILFTVEDDRFEIDMLLERLKSTIEKAEELLDKINDNTIKPGRPICLKDHFTVINLRCIECLYGVDGLDMMNELEKNVPLVLPVILNRLKHKQEEVTRFRSDFNKKWLNLDQ